MHRPLTLLALALACACAEPALDPPPEALADGVYEVLAVERDRAALPSGDADTRVLVYDHRFVQDGAEAPPDHVLLHVRGYAPLDLAEAPTPGEAHGRAVLLLTLEPEAGRALTRLTSHADRAAVVIGGSIVTVHRIRVPIEGGRLQVSC